MFTKTARWYDTIYSSLGKDYTTESRRVMQLINETLGDTIQDAAQSRKTLLDVACGTGLHLEHLAENYDVEGIDLDEGMVDIARNRLPNIILHVGDMVNFDLHKTYDIVTCLFSSIGYVVSIERLYAAAVTLAAHTKPGGMILVEPWLSPEVFKDGLIHAQFVDEDDVKIARMSISKIVDGVSIIDFEYLIASKDGIERHKEPHRLGLFTHDDYMDSLTAAGLDVQFNSDGLFGRGVYVCTKPNESI